MNGAWTYYLIIFISFVFSILPRKILYLFSDTAYFLVYYLAKYRRKTVLINLSKSFPEKQPKELQKIEKNFYRFFCDSFFENLILPFLSPKKLKKRFVYKNPEILEPFFRDKKCIMLVVSHYANWEMAIQMPIFIKQNVFAAYKPLSNKGMDRFFLRSRERFGVKTIPMKSIAKKLATNIQKDKPTLAYMLSDQRPDRGNVRYWTFFLNQDTPVLLGSEKISVKYNLPVFFLDIKRVRRGYYEATFELLEDNPKETSEFEITEKHVRYLEKMIRREPSLWLWTHRRWKHRRIIDFLEMSHRQFNSPGVQFSQDIKNRYRNQ